MDGSSPPTSELVHSNAKAALRFVVSTVGVVLGVLLLLLLLFFLLVRFAVDENDAPICLGVSRSAKDRATCPKCKALAANTCLTHFSRVG